MITSDIATAAAALRRGEVVAIPTETVYGLAANIGDEAAVRKVFTIKNRPLHNPLIVHISGSEALSDVTVNVPETAKMLAQQFWPGPLTLLLQKRPDVPDIITAGKPTVAVRVPDHPLTLQLLAALEFPLAAPSANPFGRISPTDADQVEQYFGDAVPVVLDGGRCTRGIESTIVGFDSEKPVIYRLGSIPREEIEALLGHSVPVRNQAAAAPDAPGMLPKHYAPRTPLVLTDDVPTTIQRLGHKRMGALLFRHPLTNVRITHQVVLSASGDLAEAAFRLYAALHELDNAGLDCIVAERLPDVGLGQTINDKLERASTQEP